MTSRIPASAFIALCAGAVALLSACGSSAKTTAGAGASASVATSAPAVAGSPSTGIAATEAATEAATSATTGGASSGSASGGTPDPCTLLTAAQVSAATGGTVGDGKSETQSGPLGGKKCNWSNSGSPVIDFEVTVQTNADITAPGQTVDTLFDDTTSTFPGLTAATGIGSKAFFGKTQGYVRVGNYLVTTVADIGGTADSSSINKTLTAEAVAKLS